MDWPVIFAIKIESPIELQGLDRQVFGLFAPGLAGKAGGSKRDPGGPMSQPERGITIGVARVAPPNVVSKTIGQHFYADSAFLECRLVLRHLIETRHSD